MVHFEFLEIARVESEEMGGKQSEMKTKEKIFLRKNGHRSGAMEEKRKLKKLNNLFFRVKKEK